MVGNLSTVFEVNEYDDTFYQDMFKLLEKGVSPHYLGTEIQTLTQLGQVKMILKVYNLIVK